MNQGYAHPGWGGAPSPPLRRSGPAPVILGALIGLALVMAGLVVYSLFSGPDYQNDDYVPPPAGQVKQLPFDQIDEDDLETLLVNNPLYATAVPVPVRCELTQPELDMASSSDAEVNAYIDELMGCAMRVWDRPFRQTERFELVRPTVNVYHHTVQTPCGGGRESGPNASYCAANQQVYFSRQLANAHPSFSEFNDPHVVDLVMAHEFAHAVQARSTILFLSVLSGQQAADPSVAQEFSRRTELQADCFAGQFVGAVRQSLAYDQADLERLYRVQDIIGDDNITGRPEVDGGHGHGASRQYWYQMGLSTPDVGACNTFTAPSDYVR